MRLGDLNAIIGENERQLAPGSETELLEAYNETMRKACGQAGMTARDVEVDVPDAVAAHWLGVYAAELFARECRIDGEDVRTAKVGDWDSGAWSEDNRNFATASHDALWPEYSGGFDDRLHTLRIEAAE